jgi:hypothetical protein
MSLLYSALLFFSLFVFFQVSVSAINNPLRWMAVFLPWFGHPCRFKTTLSFSPLFLSLFRSNLHCLSVSATISHATAVCLSVTTLLRTLTFVIYEHRYTTWRHAQLYVYVRDSNKVGGHREANVNLVVPEHGVEILVEFVWQRRREKSCVLRDWVMKFNVLVKFVALVLCIRMFLVSNLITGCLVQ